MGKNISKKNKIKNFIINHRKTSLLIAGLCGIGLAILAYCLLPCVLPERLKTSLVMLVLALPTVFLLWLFRTHDVREQIREAQTNNQFNNFANAMKLFVETDNKESISIGLKLLMKIKHQGLYEEEIDLATRYKDLHRAKLRGADLQGANLLAADLRGAELWGANLQGANLLAADLQGAELWGADLQGVSLQWAYLREAKLQKAKLQKANLRMAFLQGADLQGADLREANLQEAEYDDDTKFPDGFNPKKEGMIKKPYQP